MTDRTEHQRAHAAAFDAKPRDVSKVNFAHYEKKKFGPWNPYWHVYKTVSQEAAKGKRLLVVGCGRGRDALIYASKGYDVDGIDISVNAISCCDELANNTTVRLKILKIA